MQGCYTSSTWEKGHGVIAGGDLSGFTRTFWFVVKSKSWTTDNSGGWCLWSMR